MKLLSGQILDAAVDSLLVYISVHILSFVSFVVPRVLLVVARSFINRSLWCALVCCMFVLFAIVLLRFAGVDGFVSSATCTSHQTPFRKGREDWAGERTVGA